MKSICTSKARLFTPKVMYDTSHAKLKITSNTQNIYPKWSLANS